MQASLFAAERPPVEFTPEFLLRALAEFIRAVEWAGGTTPHMLMTVESIRRLDSTEEKLWRAGCYALVYNWPTAEIIWQRWRPADFERGAFERWAAENWAGLPLRRERKAVRSPAKLAESAESYLAYARAVPGRRWFRGDGGHLLARLDFCAQCMFMGRYIAIRWLETMRRAFDLPDLAMPDLLPAGGQHPRKALAMLYPEDAEALLGGDTPAELAVAHRAAAQCMAELETRYGVRTNYYELQSLLCEAKQQWLAAKQYPAKSLDTEMDYLRKVEAFWGTDAEVVRSEFLSVRRACFPPWALGEESGWEGVRKPLGATLRTWGYVWSDRLLDWRATTDLSSPVWRPGSPSSILEAAAE